VEGLNLPVADQHEIFWGNAERLLNMKFS